MPEFTLHKRFLRIRCCGNYFTEPLPSNVRLLCFHYPGLHASCQNILAMWLASERIAFGSIQRVSQNRIFEKIKKLPVLKNWLQIHPRGWTGRKLIQFRDEAHTIGFRERNKVVGVFIAKERLTEIQYVLWPREDGLMHLLKREFLIRNPICLWSDNICLYVIVTSFLQTLSNSSCIIL
jgi:hypothetical protein